MVFALAGGNGSASVSSRSEARINRIRPVGRPDTDHPHDGSPTRRRRKSGDPSINSTRCASSGSTVARSGGANSGRRCDMRHGRLHEKNLPHSLRGVAESIPALTAGGIRRPTALTAGMLASLALVTYRTHCGDLNIPLLAAWMRAAWFGSFSLGIGASTVSGPNSGGFGPNPGPGPTRTIHTALDARYRTNDGEVIPEHDPRGIWGAFSQSDCATTDWLIARTDSRRKISR